MTSPVPIRRAGRRAAEILLWCGAGLGTLSIVAAVAAVTFGVVPLVFISGSMSPEVPTGSLGLARTVDASELRVGDVVSVTAASETRVTHRIVAIKEQSDLVVLTLKGDTNPSSDQESYRVKEADRVFFTAPYLGRVIMFLTGPWGMFLGGMAAAALLFWAFRRQPPSVAGNDTEGDEHRPAMPSGKPRRPRADHASPRASATLLAVGIPALLLITTNSGTAAYFTDTGTVGTTGFGTHRVLQPSPITCTASGNTITVSTPQDDQRYTYWARAYTAAEAGTATGTSGYKKMIGSPAVVTFDKSELIPAPVVGTTYWLRIHSRFGATGTTGSSGWESAEYRRQPFGWNGSTLFCGEASPPNIVFNQPTNGSHETRLQIVTACERDTSGYGSADPLACGTAIDNGTVVSVQYILQRSGGGSNCWSGASWGSNCTYRNAARSGNRWSVSGAGNNPYNNFSRYSYTLTIKATDDNGFVSERTITYRVQ